MGLPFGEAKGEGTPVRWAGSPAGGRREDPPRGRGSPWFPVCWGKNKKVERPGKKRVVRGGVVLPRLEAKHAPPSPLGAPPLCPQTGEGGSFFGNEGGGHRRGGWEGAGAVFTNSAGGKPRRGHRF